MKRNIAGFAIVAAVSSLFATAATAACDTGMLRNNMRWQKENSPEASQKIAQGCKMMRDGNQNDGWKLVVEGYKFGQRNPLAAMLIDDCSQVEVFIAACA